MELADIRPSDAGLSKSKRLGPPTRSATGSSRDQRPSAAAQEFVVGSVSTAVGAVPQVSRQFAAREHLGAWKVRWGVGRMTYRVVPGLYALGQPTRGSKVLVTANYKLTFDLVRSRAPQDLDAWLLVLDTRAVNVWCAAGKGTFGTQELVARLRSTFLDQVVDHRELIVPQLGAPGVAAHVVKRETGFRVAWGPIRIEDLGAYLAAGTEAMPAMRRKRFPFAERLGLIPIELVVAAKWGGLMAVLFTALGALGFAGSYWSNLLTHGLWGFWAIVFGVVGGAIVVPLALPILPGRSFAAKGAWAAVVLGMVGLAWLWPETWDASFGLEQLGWWLVMAAVSSFLGMNFTGASTYTSLSGVKVEMRVGVPVQMAAVALGLVLQIAARLAV